MHMHVMAKKSKFNFAFLQTVLFKTSVLSVERSIHIEYIAN